MDCTSDFDFICRNVPEYFFVKLNNEQKLDILNTAEEYINNQYKLKNKKFNSFNSRTFLFAAWRLIVLRRRIGRYWKTRAAGL
jgi:hypothetical protein